MSGPLSGARRLFTAVVLLAIVAPSASAQTSKATGAKRVGGTVLSKGTTAAGYYTADQAARGEKVFTTHCMVCHARADLSNPDFQLKWNGRTVYDLFERLQSTMPESDPGGLATAEYADVVAYLMKLNGMPAGKIVVAPGPALKQQKLALVPTR
jgi:mono/diheme cytochrome c family protein